MVQISSRELPGLRGDKGDIQILHDGGYLPFRIKEKNGMRDSFQAGQLLAVNWENFSGLKLSGAGQKHGRKYKAVKCVIFLIYKVLGKNLERISMVIEDVMNEKQVNPEEVQ